MLALAVFNLIQLSIQQQSIQQPFPSRKVSKRLDNPIFNNNNRNQQPKSAVVEHNQNMYDQVLVDQIPKPVPERVVAPFTIQKPVLSYTGEVIIENTIGGIPFDCRFKPTGHWRDGYFCDIFHACVHGYQRKTYACPIVGERTYFDELTQRCEFVSLNPAICA